MSLHNDTIAAIATPIGEGGIAVIRLSGPNAVGIASRCITSATAPISAASHTVTYASVRTPDGERVDDVLYTVFRAPRSYTGEDVVEISCHGGQLVTRRVLESLLHAGARAAGPGEFTKRAFLAGKIDLAQAEAVAELIHASSDRAHKTSLSHLHGELSDRVESIRTQLMDALALLELELDFAEDGYELVDKTRVEELLNEAIRSIADLIGSYSRGKVIRDGVQVVLAGAPNAGKSSLMNRLLRESRAIVTEVPGTTRDVISENIMIQGVLFRLTDTAGIRESGDIVEREGVRRSKDKLNAADVILFILDATRDPVAQLAEIGDEALAIVESRHARVLLAYNKVDIVPHPLALPKKLGRHIGGEIAMISAKTGEGIEGLEEALISHVPELDAQESPEGETVTLERHYSAFLRVSEALQASLESLRNGQTGEFIAIDLRTALDNLGEVVGKVTSEDVLNSIFSRFCIGK